MKLTRRCVNEHWHIFKKTCLQFLYSSICTIPTHVLCEDAFKTICGPVDLCMRARFYNAKSQESEAKKWQGFTIAWCPWLLLMEEILHLYKTLVTQWDKLPTSTGDRRISSRVFLIRIPGPRPFGNGFCQTKVIEVSSELLDLGCLHGNIQKVYSCMYYRIVYVYIYIYYIHIHIYVRECNCF